MKLAALAALCLLFLMFHTQCSLAKKSSGSKSSSSSTRSSSSSSSSSNTAKKNSQSSSSQDRSKQPGQTSQGGQNQGGYNQGGYNQGGYNQGGYNQGGYHNQNPAWGSPYGRNYGGYGGYGRYGGHGRYGRYGGHGRYGGYGGYGGDGGYGGYGGGYPGGYINQNPNNRILSPQYGGSYGYGGYSAGGGSPFSQSVLAMNMVPTDKSKGFGRGAARRVDGGVMTGMALGYGLGRFPRPHFQMRSPQEEYHYNHYMYRKYGVKSTDDNDYSRDYSYSEPPQSYDSYMESCMKGKLVLSVESPKQSNKSAPAATATVVTTTSSNTTDTNTTAAENTTNTSSSSLTPGPPDQPVSSEEDDDDTVSIVEIGYPALIKQLKTRQCLEQYMASSEKYFKKDFGGVQGLASPRLEIVAVASTVLVMLLNSNRY